MLNGGGKQIKYSGFKIDFQYRSFSFEKKQKCERQSEGITLVWWRVVDGLNDNDKTLFTRSD